MLGWDSLPHGLQQGVNCQLHNGVRAPLISAVKFPNVKVLDHFGFKSIVLLRPQFTQVTGWVSALKVHRNVGIVCVRVEGGVLSCIPRCRFNVLRDVVVMSSNPAHMSGH